MVPFGRVYMFNYVGKYNRMCYTIGKVMVVLRSNVEEVNVNIQRIYIDISFGIE